MPDEEEITELESSIIRDATDGIQSASGDGQSMTRMSIKDQLELLKYTKTSAAAARGFGGIKFVKLIPPGQD